MGGKLTTCRSLAEGAAAEILAVLGRPVTATSRSRPLPGACSAREAEELVGRLSARAVAAGLPGPVAEGLARGVVGLLGARAERALEGGAGASAADAFALLAGSRLPRGIVRYCCDEEWGETLADLVERRLLLVFDPDLTVTTLRAIAAELVTEGRLGAESVDGEIAALVALMADRYGKRLVD